MTRTSGKSFCGSVFSFLLFKELRVELLVIGKKPSGCSPYSCTVLYPQTVCEDSHCSTSLLAFTVVSLFYFGHFRGHEYHCGFNLLFPDDWV